MKDRIVELMKRVGKNPTDFANTIEISPAVLSSIKSGRTKPTLFLVEKIKSVYPNININWLITGEGNMFTDEDHEMSLVNEIHEVNEVNEVDEVHEVNKVHKVNEVHEQIETQMLKEPDVVMRVENKKPDENESWQVKTVIKPESKKISQIVVLYDDGTFETLTK